MQIAPEWIFTEFTDWIYFIDKAKCWGDEQICHVGNTSPSPQPFTPSFCALSHTDTRNNFIRSFTAHIIKGGKELDRTGLVQPEQSATIISSHCILTPQVHLETTGPAFNQSALTTTELLYYYGTCCSPPPLMVQPDQSPLYKPLWQVFPYSMWPLFKLHLQQKPDCNVTSLSPSTLKG